MAQMPDELLVTLLVKVAVAASLASILVRSSRFLRMLMREERLVIERLEMAVVCAALFGAGVATRIATRGTYGGVDVGLEGSLILGLVAGYFAGLVGGVLISIPALIAHEPLTIVLFAAVGVLGGLVRDLAPEPEDIWQFSPWFDQNIYRIFRGRFHDLRRTAYALVISFTILLAEILRISMAAISPKRVFSLYRPGDEVHWLIILALFVSTFFAVGLPIKIWNNSRNEKKLESQQLLLNEARLAALQRQINPHFLFNTLNSVAALIRQDPEQARSVVYKLSAILRRLLRKQENFSSLREELSFIDDYLAIEVVRFGPKLRVEKEIEAATLDYPVPSMLLQPLVENSIKHGLSSKVNGGRIRLRARLVERKLLLTIEDDGVGIPEEKLASLFDQGIGVSNVNERLKVLFGEDYKMWVESRLGEGTTTGIEIPTSTPSAAAAV